MHVVFPKDFRDGQFILKMYKENKVSGVSVANKKKFIQFSATTLLHTVPTYFTLK